VLPAWGQAVLLTESFDAGTSNYLPNCGHLTGYVTNCYNSAPLAGAIVICGTKSATTDATGHFTILNILAGNYNVSIICVGFVSAVVPAVIISQQTTTLNPCLNPIPGTVHGIVTNSTSGAPIVGARVMLGTAYTYSVSGGSYSISIYPCGVYSLSAFMPGFDSYVAGPFSIVCGNTITQNIALLPSKLPPGPVAAGLNSGGTAVNLSWESPPGPYEIVYDDGIQDAFTVWADAGNQNAVKFTPAGYPATLTGGSVNLGNTSNYPGATFPLAPFQVKVMAGDGAGGMPGTVLATYDVTPTGNSLGWISLPAMNVTLTSGSFYLVMVQGGIPPNGYGIAIDTTTPQLRSYSRFVTGGGGWIPASGNFMMRIVMTGPGGPLPPQDNFSGTLSVIGYQLSRLKQGEENLPANWTLLVNTTSNSYTDNAWPSLSCAPYRWAIKSMYPGGGLSNATFSNVLGKCWTAGVTVNFSAPCNYCIRNATVTMMNVTYPDTLYTATTDTNGTVHFADVWKGTYSINLLRFGCPAMTKTAVIHSDTTLTVSTTQGPNAYPANYLEVNGNTLLASWSPPRANSVIFNEDWSSGSFATNQWTVTGGTNWQISTGIGNPAPSAEFSWTPQCTNCSQMLTSRTIQATHAQFQRLRYDFTLSNFGTTTVSTLAVELWDGNVWNVLQTHNNQNGNIAWTTETLDISAYSNIDFKIRFRVSSGDTYDINYWSVDNIQVIGSTWPLPCLLGYNVSLNNTLGAFTPDTLWHIPPWEVQYGQTYQVCVTAVYSGSYSTPVCKSFVDHFVYAPENLAVQPLECTAYLTWTKPRVQTGGGPGGTPPGLIGYNIYRNYTFLHYIPDPDTLQYYDNGLDPGNYTYDITAKYDMTYYGFPGQFAESQPTAYIPVSITCGAPLPFNEDWSSGTFSFNGWGFSPDQGNWGISMYEKSLAPFADFCWQPLRTNYNYAMESRAVDASPWSCSDIWFDFEYKLTDRHTTGNEKLYVEDWYNNSWHSLLELSNNGSVGWTTKHLRIDEVRQKGFKIRFRAAGRHSDDILHWYVDNIHIYGVCRPPGNLAGWQDGSLITLSWAPPDCGSSQLTNFILDDGSAEDGWAINPGNIGWLGNEFPVASYVTGVLKSLDLYFQYNGSAGTQQLTVDIFDASHNLTGSSAAFHPPNDDLITIPLNDIPFAGPFYAMVKWNNLSTATNYLGEDMNGPYVTQDLAWCNDGTGWTKLSVAAGTNPGVFLLRASAIVSMEMKKVDLIPSKNPSAKTISASSLNRSNRRSDTHNYTVMGLDTPSSDSSLLIGYNVYRAINSYSPFTLQTPVPVTGTTWSEPVIFPMIFPGYYITSVYTDAQNNSTLCEARSDTIFVLFIGIGEQTTRGSLKVFPNPASSRVNVTASSVLDQVEVMNLFGETLYRRDDLGVSSLQIDVSKWAPGIYLLKAKGPQVTASVKLVINP